MSGARGKRVFQPGSSSSQLHQQPSYQYTVRLGQRGTGAPIGHVTRRRPDSAPKPRKNFERLHCSPVVSKLTIFCVPRQCCGEKGVRLPGRSQNRAGRALTQYSVQRLNWSGSLAGKAVKKGSWWRWQRIRIRRVISDVFVEGS